MKTKANKLRITGLIFAIFTLGSGIVPLILDFGHKENSRIVFYKLNDPVIFVFYLGISACLYWCFDLFAQRLEILSATQESKRKISKKLFIKALSMSTVLKGKNGKVDAAGVMHAFIYFGFIGLLISTILLEIDHQLPLALRFLHNWGYAIFAAFSDVSGVFFVTGTLWAITRRFAFRPKRIRTKTTFEDGVILANLLLIGITGFVLEGFRMLFEPVKNDNWSFVGYFLSLSFEKINSSTNWAIVRHEQFWILHAFLFGMFLMLLPVTKLKHMVTSPVNIAMTERERPEGALRDMGNLLEDDVDTIGTRMLSDYEWKAIFDTQSCTECGRCTSVCPAQAAGKKLDPRKIILDIAQATLAGEDVMELISPEEVWACTTCKACDEICPVNIDIMDKIIDIRRNLMLMDNEFPSELNSAYRGMESASNPWGLAQSDREEWIKKATADGIEVKVLKEGETASDYDVLYWVGCAGSFDEKNKKVTLALAAVLNKAGRTFAVLGGREKCTGDPARRSGNEYLFQMLATQNIETLNEAKPKVILTQCPHCFNTLQNEYPQLGGMYKVIHHSEYLADLVDSGELEVNTVTKEDITIHDSCYLTRHNNIVDAPRKVVGSLKGINLYEMNASGKDNFCCGAGGGQFFMEEKGDVKVNSIRVNQAEETGAKTMATMCPFCNVMMSDGVDANDGDMEVKDIAIILAERI